jgi:3-oxoacyl-[acyl-carrier protein] reductase
MKTTERTEDMSLEGQIALVTGASRGIGAATAKLLAQNGAAVAVNYYKSEAAANDIVKAITSAGGKAVAVYADVRKADEVKPMVKRAVDELGPIDILVLNAGAQVPMKPFMELTNEEFEAKVMGELNGFFHTLKAVVPSMIQRKKGCIIGISSGLSRRPGHAFSAHTTAKSAVDGLMKSLALELGPFGIRANTIAPGLTVTDATSHLPKERFEMAARYNPMRRVAEPEDIAGAVLALVSENARFVTGAYIPVSGGDLML